MESKVNKLVGPIGGVGQGGGGSPIIWLGVLMIMLDAYPQMSEGITIQHRTTGMRILYWIISYVDDNTILRNFQNATNIRFILKEMKKSLLIWNELLSLTGGGLSLGKCKILVMYWKQDFWGKLKIDEKDRTGISINTRHSNDNKEEIHNLERISAFSAERILGIRLSMSGEMKQEYEYRKEHIDNLAHRLYTAPFSPADAYIVYSTRYKPMIRYALPITTFTQQQLENIQKRFIHLLLPKLGLNRNTPRDVIFGPRKMGGRELMDLRVEQPSLHITTTIGHLRRNDKAGKLLLTTMHDTQLELGIKSFFLKVDPQIYQYGTKNTRWRYIWEFTHSHAINLEIYNYWIPPDTPYRNDKVIMEQAVQDKFFHTGKAKHYLEIVNNCRMFLGVIYLSEIADRDGRIPLQIQNGSGEERITNKYNYPKMRKPPAAAWSVWKAFIWRNFLQKDGLIHPPLIPQQSYTTKRYKITPATIHYIVKKPTLKETINTMPKEYLEILGKITIPEDNGKHLWEGIKKGTVIGASD